LCKGRPSSSPRTNSVQRSSFDDRKGPRKSIKGKITSTQQASTNMNTSRGVRNQLTHVSKASPSSAVPVPNEASSFFDSKLDHAKPNEPTFLITTPPNRGGSYSTDETAASNQHTRVTRATPLLQSPPLGTRKMFLSSQV